MISAESPFAPLRHPWFRWLWLVVWVAYVGGWVQLVGAQWALVIIPDAGAAVALVPTAVLLPVLLLTIPAQALADIVDRQLLMIVVSACVCVLAGSLAVVSALGRATPGVLVIFTFGLGVAGALLLPTWRSVVTELVPSDQVHAATWLDLLSFDVARIVGPLLAGLVIVVSGVWNAFTLTAFSVIFLGALPLLWRHIQRTDSRSEPAQPTVRLATHEGVRDPVLRRSLLRTVLFAAPAAAWWALLPLVARDQLSLDAAGYGTLLAAFGVGALVTDVLAGRLQATPRLVVAGAGVVFAAALVAIGWLPGGWLALLVGFLAGVAWTAVTRSLGCVRAEGSVLLPMTFAGSLALASALWGQLAELVGVRWTFLVAAAGVLAGVVVSVVGTEADTEVGPDP